eukprot:CAMPEP_0197051950 /NCGR_PEP_ID=MMETSP1384-20130603/26506_1 /TAXON_ID=29189 /ORGANISM="Ammonia sp." /LENGTH=172 /DNA_ID=CAMNT_0042484579 /DNA_START=167 /DNA_END=682 /DNA_ORIENTATION=-
MLGGLLWTTTKLAGLLFFVARLDVAFRSSSFKFSRKVFVFLYILVTLGWISCNVEYILFGGAVKVSTTEPFDTTYCESQSPYWTLLYFALCDLTLSLCLNVIFAKRLLDAFLMNRQSTDSQSGKRVIRNVARYVTLSIVSSTTTVISLLILATTGYFGAIALDMIVNNHCIL